MGALCTKDDSLVMVDDSVHVMMKHDRKKMKAQKQRVNGYVPRAEHPSMMNHKREAFPGPSPEQEQARRETFENNKLQEETTNNES